MSESLTETSSQASRRLKEGIDATSSLSRFSPFPDARVPSIKGAFYLGASQSTVPYRLAVSLRSPDNSFHGPRRAGGVCGDIWKNAPINNFR